MFKSTISLLSEVYLFVSINHAFHIFTTDMTLFSSLFELLVIHTVLSVIRSIGKFYCSKCVVNILIFCLRGNIQYSVYVCLEKSIPKSITKYCKYNLVFHMVQYGAMIRIF